ncbi:MAG: hypothetical protein Q4G59_08625, partial [Planctomycetia bacterium]|nr:hypothetical protein [Planctomycetia bacterium]
NNKTTADTKQDTKKEETKTAPAQTTSNPSETVVTAAPVTTPINAEEAMEVKAQLDDEVWLVSNSYCQPVGPSSLTWSRLEDCQFVASTYETYHANETALPTVIFIHGNLTDMSSAVESGMYLKSRLEAIRNRLGIDSAFRLVIWKWNSEKAFAGIRKDSQYKAAVADEDGRSLAEFLRNDTAAHTTLLGFSFGAKIIGSACNILATTEHKTYNAIFVSAATEYYDYASCGCYSSGACCLDYLLNLYNPEDKALRFYPLLYGRGGAPALGTMPFTTDMITPCLQGKAFSLSSSYCGNQHKFASFMQCIPDQTLADIVFSFSSEEK